MKRKTSSNPTRIYTFGCWIPPEHRAAFYEQLRLGHQYRNKRVEIEREKRAAYRAARAEMFPALAEAEAAVEAADAEVERLVTALNAKRGAARARVRDEALEREIAAAKTKRKAANVAAKAWRTEAKGSDVLAAVSAELNERSGEARRAANTAPGGAHWGTRGLVDKASDAAFKANEPRFARWTGEGRVGGQVQTLADGDSKAPLSVGGLFSARSKIVQIDPLDADQWATRSGRRHAWTAGRIRVGSTDSREPVWLPFEVLLHRPLPSDAVVKWAWILARKEGPKAKFVLQLTLEAESFVHDHEERGPGVAAVDFGWKRAADGGIEVAFLLDATGHSETFSLPACGTDGRRHSILQSLDYADHLRSVGDRVFDDVKGELHAWLKATEVAPDWLREECSHVWQWRARQKLSRVAWKLAREASTEAAMFAMWTRWKADRRVAGEDLFQPFGATCEMLGLGPSSLLAMAIWLEWWRRKDRHLYQWEANERGAAERSRQDVYRKWVAGLRRRYSRIVIGEQSFIATQRNKPAEAERPEVTAVHLMQRRAAPSVLRDAMAGMTETVTRETVAKWQHCDLDIMPSDWATCWALLDSHGCDTSAVRQAWDVSRAFWREGAAIAAE